VSTRKLPAAHQILAIMLLAVFSITGLSYRGAPISEDSAATGQIILQASATEPQTLEKEVGQIVHFKACVKNTGNVEATYIIIAQWRVDGADTWESGGIADISLLPGHYETLYVGGVECTEAMMGEYFDVKFILYDHETENLLDQKEIDKAWHVKETIVTGAITSFWIE
jgi:hypothetical protein